MVLLYDFKDASTLALHSALSDFLLSIVGPSPQSEIQNLKVLAHIYPGIPVLSAVQIDISGKYEGMNIKAGADYKTPQLKLSVK